MIFITIMGLIEFISDEEILRLNEELPKNGKKRRKTFTLLQIFVA